MRPEVKIIGITRFVDEIAIESTAGVWRPDPMASDGELLTEFAGRSCYQSWEKPNPKTAKTAGYLAHIEEVGHWSVMEHATVTFYIKNVSRSLTHELIRHRHLSPSQLSQRFVVLNPVRSTEDFVVPPLFYEDETAGEILLDAWEAAVNAYEALLQRAEVILGDDGVKGSRATKRAREAARAVLPNMTPTAVVLTGNHRAWREMLLKRLQPEADAEIAALAEILFKLLSDEEPALYQDLEVIMKWPEGEHTGGRPSLRVIGSVDGHE